MNNRSINLDWQSVFIGLSLCLLVVIVFRAFNLSITHDEAGTFLFYNDVSIIDFFLDKSIWDTANNHLLNTLLYQQSINILGFSDFNLRLPNVLSFIIYSLSIFYIIKLKFQRYLLLACLLVCLTLLNPYLLDFFSLARGYGLSVAFISLSILMLLYYFKQRSRRYLVLHFFCLILSSLAILSNLVLIACSMFAIIIVSLLWDRRELINILRVCLPILVLSALLFYTPIRALLDKNEFQFGVPYLYDSYRFFVEDYLISKRYLGKVTVPIVLLIIFILIILSSLGIAVKIIKNKFVELSTAWILIFFLSINLALVCTYYFFGSQYPANRKFLFMVPIISYLICKGLDCYFEYKYFKPAISAIILFSIIHMFSIKPTSTREWWYDATTKQIIEDLDKKYCYDKQCKLGTNWMFHPSSTYYITTAGLNNIQLSGYNKALKRSETDDFFICFNSDFETLKDKYVVLEAYSYSVYLLKAKD